MKPRACTAATVTNIPLLQALCSPHRQHLLPSPVGDTPKGPHDGSEPPPVPHPGTALDQEVFPLAPTFSEKFGAAGCHFLQPYPEPQTYLG